MRKIISFILFANIILVPISAAPLNKSVFPQFKSSEQISQDASDEKRDKEDNNSDDEDEDDDKDDNRENKQKNTDNSTSATSTDSTNEKLFNTNKLNETKNDNDSESEGEKENPNPKSEKNVLKRLENNSSKEFNTNSDKKIYDKLEKLIREEKGENGVETVTNVQINLVAMQQKLAQEEIEKNLQLIESRPKIAKYIFGPRYDACENLKKIMVENNVRINKLETLQEQAISTQDKESIKGVLAVLTEQNNKIKERVDNEERGSSLLGWLIKFVMQNF